ncbi:hypothetical protein Tsubulata_005801 [Turnera subulata]|uniref:BZIP domain-containing protein n=1 Tax=Turnera subulata TaxID=218843 RepID=A0A9Q0JQU5_9ROSI|nr:hypothetical protein Tsubulata_005801 [Turnera subulata]
MLTQQNMFPRTETPSLPEPELEPRTCEDFPPSPPLPPPPLLRGTPRNDTWRAQIHGPLLRIDVHRCFGFPFAVGRRMETELRRASASSSGSTTSSGEQLEAADREMEAAEALADLAHLAVRESGAASAAEWGSKGKRAKKRVKSESPSSDSLLNPVTPSLLPYPDLALDQTIVHRQNGDPSCGNLVINPPKAEPDVDLSKPALTCPRNYPSFGGGRSRQNLSEAEKEARRLRRILANRESARQTIRRRQALCDELAKKAADLTCENQNLKREKELALKEFQSLEITNKHLKAQMAKVIKAEMESSPGELMSSRVELPSTATNCPLFLYNHHPFSPLCWRPIVQSSNPVQSCHGAQDVITMQSNIHVPSNGKLDPCQQPAEKPINTNGVRTPLYILPCPWFFPVPDTGGALHQPCFGLKHQGGSSAHDPCSGSSSSKTAVLGESQCSSLPVRVKSETTSLVEHRIINDLNETPAGFSLDGDGQSAGPQPKEMTFAPLPPSSISHKVGVKNESGPEYSNCSPNDVCAKASRGDTCLLGKRQDLFKFPSKKAAGDAVAAAEARRRRKELTKLKNLHGRQCRMNC